MVPGPDRLISCDVLNRYPEIRPVRCQHQSHCLETAAEEPDLEELSLKTLRTVDAGTEAEGRAQGAKQDG